MERTLFLVLAVVGYLISGIFALLGGDTITWVFFALASVPMAIWVIAVGVSIGVRDALGVPTEEDRIKDATDHWRQSAGTSGRTVTDPGTPEQPR